MSLSGSLGDPHLRVIEYARAGQLDFMTALKRLYNKKQLTAKQLASVNFAMPFVRGNELAWGLYEISHK